jgi:antitoxin component YwqK of YwqJK toxin-antitoxin module
MKFDLQRYSRLWLCFLLCHCGLQENNPVNYKQLELKDDCYCLNAKPYSGEAVAYNKNGTVRARYFFLEGQFDGRIVEFWPNGQQSVEVFMKKGKRHGSNTYWDDKGKMTKHQEYEMDQVVKETIY